MGCLCPRLLVNKKDLTNTDGLFDENSHTSLTKRLNAGKIPTLPEDSSKQRA